MSDIGIWIGILLCITQSACFSGLNLAFFSLNRMQLEIECARGDRQAKIILALREDANFLLVTILWGNVGINVLLTLLSDSVLAGGTAFLFSTFAITLFGEIGPQAYFSRNAKAMASLLAPLLRFYQVLLWPLARPTATVLDRWLGKEAIQYIREKDIKAMLLRHVEAEQSDLDAVEGMGALNFLSLDDLPAGFEGESLDADSILPLPLYNGRIQFPSFERRSSDAFLQAINQSGYSWVVFTDQDDNPRYVLDADGFLRHALLDKNRALDPLRYCHRPLLVGDENVKLSDVILKLKADQGADEEADAAIAHDVVLVWTPSMRKIITGADLLGRLLKGVERFSIPPPRAT